MVRTLLAASVIYCYAHPLFDGLRPATLERPLQFFYAQCGPGRIMRHRISYAQIRLTFCAQSMSGEIEE